MKFKQLKKSLTEKVENIYLVSGEDAFFVERSVKLICDACLEMPDLNLTVFNGGDLKGNTEKLISALVSYPFMSEKRVVLCREYYPLSAELKALSDYFESPCETTVFIICNSKSSDNIAKQKNVTFVDCSKGDESLLCGWITSTAKASGLSVTPRCAALIVNYCGGDMTKINGEVQKLIAYSINDGEITEDAVNSLCVKETDYQLYEIVDFIADRRYEKAYTTITEMIGSGDGQKVFASLYYYFRRLLYVSVSGMTNAEIASALKIKEYAVKMAAKQAEAFSTKRLKAVVDKLSLYDSQFKSGEISPDNAVWNGIFEVLVG